MVVSQEEELREKLKEYFGFSSFRGTQEKIISNLLSGRNTFVLMPTGAGKSLCYQLPAIIREGTAIVISPLIALMKNQVDQMNAFGINAQFLNSTLNKTEIRRVKEETLAGNIKMLYVAPESLTKLENVEFLKSATISFAAIDEAHCISEWGHDFRPAYLKIPILNDLHPNTPIIGLTATATSRVIKNIIEHLDIPNAKIIKQSLVRKNLALRIIHSEDFYYYLKHILSSTSLPSILYASSRKKVKSVSDYLNKNNFKSTYYHGGLSTQEKQLSFSNWMLEKTPIMVATNAFGMGIDKENVQQIIHLDIPNSLENYMQEAGRAGRNENKAFSYIFAGKHNISNLKRQFSKSKLSIEFTKTIYKVLNQYFQIAYGELSTNSFEFHLTHFCSRYNLNVLRTYNTLK